MTGHQKKSKIGRNVTIRFRAAARAGQLPRMQKKERMDEMTAEWNSDMEQRFEELVERSRKSAGSIRLCIQNMM